MSSVPSPDLTGPPALSAIVLCYRAGESIAAVVEPLHALLEKSGIDYEIVLIANYWPHHEDTTPEIVRRLAARHAHVVTLDFEKQGGMGWDVRSGLKVARGSTLVVIDGDAQNPVADVLRMYQLLRDTGADIGKGRRMNRGDGFLRWFMSCGFNCLFCVLFRTWPLWDINGKPKGLTRAAYERMSLESDDWFLDAEIVLKAHRRGMKIVELPVMFLANKERSSFLRFSAIWEFLIHMMRYAMWNRP